MRNSVVIEKIDNVNKTTDAGNGCKNCFLFFCCS